MGNCNLNTGSPRSFPARARALGYRVTQRDRAFDLLKDDEHFGALRIVIGATAAQMEVFLSGIEWGKSQPTANFEEAHRLSYSIELLLGDLFSGDFRDADAQRDMAEVVSHLKQATEGMRAIRARSGAGRRLATTTLSQTVQR